MSRIDCYIAILNLLAGIGIFLVACSMMSTNLEILSSNKLRDIFSKLSKNKLAGVGIGAVATAAIQSSGATTVMVIGFVNAGIMSLSQAATVIYGANIGTTITGQMVAFGMSGGGGVSLPIIFSAFAGIGGFISIFTKKDRLKSICGILSGFGMLFVALSMMSSSMNDFAKLDEVKQFLASISNTFLLIVIGALLTAIVQSSSVMTSVAITMVLAGLINLNQGIYLTMGSNIGSCVVALIAGLSGSKNAKRTSVMHLLFNVSGVIVFAIAGTIMDIVSGGALGYGALFGHIFVGSPQIQLAMFHTVFNVFTVILMLPLTDHLVKLVLLIIPDKTSDEDSETLHLYYVDENMLKTPAIAIAQVKKEIVHMAKFAMDNFNLAIKMISDADLSEKKRFDRKEQKINYINKNLVRFVVDLTRMPLSEADSRYIMSTFHTISDIERIGDYAENIVEYAESLNEDSSSFSYSAKMEIEYVTERVNALYDTVMSLYETNDRSLYELSSQLENEIDILTEKMDKNHIIRMNQGTCTPLVGAKYMALATNTERIADHIFNIGKIAKDI